MDSLPPFLWGSFIPYNMPVYPGAFRVKSSCRKLKKSPKPLIFWPISQLPTRDCAPKTGQSSNKEVRLIGMV